MRGGWALDRDELYAQAGVRPGDMDFVQTYDDYPVIALMQLEDLGFCAKGEGPAFVRGHTFHRRRELPAQHHRRPALGRPGGCRRRLSRHGRGDPPAHRRAPARSGRMRELGLVSGFGMINYDRGLCTGAAVLGGGGMTSRSDARNEEPGAAHPATDAAAVGTQPHRARPHRRGGRGPLRAAGVPGCGRAVPAARGLPRCLSLQLKWATQTGAGELISRDGAAPQQRPVLPRAAAVAARPGAARLRADGGCAPARRRCRTRPHAYGRRATRQGRTGGAHRLPEKE